MKSPAKKRLLFFLSLFLNLALLPFTIGERGCGFLFVPWVASLGGIFYSLHSPVPVRHRLPSRLRRFTFFVIIICLALAAFLRLYKIQSIPPGLWVDELYTASNALELHAAAHWQNPLRMTPLVGTGWVETSNLYLYFVRCIWLIFGVNYIGTKMVSILPGIAAVGLLFLFVRGLWGVRAGLGAAFSLAVSSWHITLSRWGWDEVLLTALQIPAYIFLLRGIKRARAFDFALSGFLLAICTYTYAASRILTVFVLLYLAAECTLNRGFFTKQKRGIGAFLLMFFLTFAPLGIYFSHHPSAFSVRAKEVSIFSEMRTQKSIDPLIKNVVRHLLMFHWRGDRNVRHNLPGCPLLDIVSGIFMLLGIFIALRGLKKTQNRFLILWLAFGLIGGILSAGKEAPQAYRTGVVAPAVFAFCGIGLAFAEKRIRRALRTKKLSVVPLTIVIGILLVITLGINVRRYFIQYPREPELWENFWGTKRTFFARHLCTRRKAGANVLLDASFRSQYYFLYRVAMRIVCKMEPEYYDPLYRKPDALPQGYEVYVPPFRRRYYERVLPAVPLAPIENPAGDISFYRADISAAALKRCPVLPPEKLRPFEVSYLTNGTLIKKEYKERLQFDSLPAGCTHILVKANLELPNAYYSVFQLKANNPTGLSINGKAVLDERGGEKVIHLVAGGHTIELRCKVIKSPVVMELLWRPDMEHTEPVPPEFLSQYSK